MAFATIFGGGLAIGVTVMTGYLLQQLGLYRNVGTIDFFVFTGPIEEISKLVGFLLFIRIFKVHFDEPVDAVVYMSCVALGFSLIENLQYALGAPILLGLRSVTATPLHIIFSTTMALVFATNVNKDKVLRSLIKAVLIASFFHGLYDAMAFGGAHDVSRLGVVIAFAMFWGRKVFGYTLLNSPHRKDMMSALSKISQTQPKACLACGKEVVHNSYAFQDGAVEECSDCETVVLSEQKATEFLNYFLPHNQDFTLRNDVLKAKLDAIFCEIHDKSYDTYKKMKIKDASPKVEALAEELRKVFEKSITFSLVFATRPVLATENGILNEQYRSTVNSDAFKIVMTLILTFGALGLFMWGLMLVTR